MVNLSLYKSLVIQISIDTGNYGMTIFVNNNFY